MRIWLDANKMAALNISPSEVNAALRSENYLSALGQTKGNLVTVNLTADSNLSSVSEFENLTVKALDDRLIRLSDIAKVELAAQNYDAAVRFAGDQAVFIGLYVQPKANAVDAIAAVERNSYKFNANFQKDWWQTLVMIPLFTLKNRYKKSCIHSSRHC